MSKEKLSDSKIKRIIGLRKSGHSYLEIKNLVGCGYGTVFRYCENIKLSSKARKIISFKQGGSKQRSKFEWDAAKVLAKNILGDISKRDVILLLVGIYWGEGTKRELNIMNGDPRLLKIFLISMRELGVLENDFIFSVRLFGIESRAKSLDYWSKNLNISKKLIKVGEIVQSNSSDRLPYGMCRIRVRKGGKYFKLIMSMIEYVPRNI